MDDIWPVYARKMCSAQPDSPEWTECRNAFFAGALSFVNLLNKQDSDEEGDALIDQLRADTQHIDLIFSIQ